MKSSLSIRNRLSHWSSAVLGVVYLQLSGRDSTGKSWTLILWLVSINKRLKPTAAYACSSRSMMRVRTLVALVLFRIAAVRGKYQQRETHSIAVAEALSFAVDGILLEKGSLLKRESASILFKEMRIAPGMLAFHTDILFEDFTPIFSLRVSFCRCPYIIFCG